MVSTDRLTDRLLDLSLSNCLSLMDRLLSVFNKLKYGSF